MSELELLECKHCGSTEMYSVETTTVERQVRGFDETGTLIIDGYSRTWDEGAGDDELLCKSCWQRSPLPEQVDYV